MAKSNEPSFTKKPPTKTRIEYNERISRRTGNLKRSKSTKIGNLKRWSRW